MQSGKTTVIICPNAKKKNQQLKQHYKDKSRPV